MKPKLTEVQIIAWGLAGLYLTSFFIYLQAFQSPSLRVHVVLLSALFLGLLAGSVGVIQHTDWGRRILVIGNGCAGIYFLIL